MLCVSFKAFPVCLLLQELGGSELEIPSLGLGGLQCILALERPCWIRCSLVHDAGQHEDQGGGFVRMIS